MQREVKLLTATSYQNKITNLCAMSRKIIIFNFNEVKLQTDMHEAQQRLSSFLNEGMAVYSCHNINDNRN